jgi:hypothetical protein
MSSHLGVSLQVEASLCVENSLCMETSLQVLKVLVHGRMVTGAKSAFSAIVNECWSWH